MYVYHLVKAANALANASRKDAGGGPRNSVQDISVGFGLDHHKNAEAKISDFVSCIPVEFHTLVRARVRSVVDPKIDTSGQLARYGCVNGTGCFNRATVSVLKLMMIIQVYPRFSTLRRRLMKLTGQTIDCYLL